MKKNVEQYFNETVALIKGIKASNMTKEVNVYDLIVEVCQLIKQQAGRGKKILFIGNGGSAAIASHMAIDFWKNGGIKALVFNEGAQLTCLGNDCGYDQVFAKPITMFADTGDLLFAISSSGKSENILNGVKAAQQKKCQVVTLSGFIKDNPLRKMGDYNFYVSSDQYGCVEVIHQFICHCILDILLKERTLSA